MDVVFLAATVPLTKSYTKSTDGTIKKTPYPMTWEFTSHAESVKDLAQFHTVLVRHAALGHCLLKGSIARPLVNESRAGATTSNDVTEWMVLDLDGLPSTYQGAKVTIDSFLLAIGLQQYSHIIQWSASSLIENDLLRAHIYLLLDKPTAAPQLKQGLIQLNHETLMLNDSMKLTKTGNSTFFKLR